MSNKHREIPATEYKSKKTADRVQQVKDFLAEHYEIKINVFDPSKSIIEARQKDMYITEPTFNDISLHMESEGIRGCDSILKKILASPNQVTTFNPITEYMQSLDGAWKGESHIDRFCSHIKVRDFGDKELEGYYQKRFVSILKKWMAAAIACSLGLKANDVMIGFVADEEGIGKTQLIEFLVPKPLRAYYTKSAKDEKFFDLPTAFSRNFIVNFDEFVGITKNKAEEIKQTLSSGEFVSPRTILQRIANGMFTSNKTQEMGGFLHPSMGYRRWAIIEVEAIDWKGYTQDVDVHQMWAEAYVLFKMADFDYVWGEKEFSEFKEHNNRYMIETHSHRLIKENYRVPEHGDAPEVVIFKQPKDILADLKKAKKINAGMGDISDVSIGLAMKSLGYIKVQKKINKISPRWGYNVVQLFES